ncbi:serine/threonine-protein phosphatase 7 long form homolog isoform X1 [Nicotiana tabacum]|uniref:Serine/threonine-protein phosphatase 7 long form homolog isoform X1 n=10 Tax=Nicotiana tabacum TaxID=4097 RepID=A0AC58TEE0_TOBAC|nr:PREDICTED: serine/threonine-protein phosphatase 7 long form homolog [Nicotiana tabacum]
MYGLPVDGQPVHAVEEQSCSMWQDEMERLTGFRPPIAALKGCRLKISAIDAHVTQLADLTDDDPDEEVHKRCRLYILWMIGGLIFPDTSGNRVNLEFLPLLEDLGKTVHYSWGSAALSYLYRCLCRSSMEQKSDIGGFLSLLQFIWQPYDEGIIADLPERCSRGRHVWMASVPLICQNIVEDHVPKRVLRQFGLAQGVPDNSQWEDAHFLRDKRYKADPVFQQFIAEQTALWGPRADRVVHDVPAHVTIPYDDPYMIWYRRITRTLIGNPVRRADRGYQLYAGQHEALGRALHYLYRMGLEMQQEAVDERVRGWARTVSAVSVEALLAASQGRRLSFDPDYAPAEYEDGPPLTLYRRGGAGRARGGRQGGRASPVGHRLVDKDDDEDSLLSVATLSTSREFRQSKPKRKSGSSTAADSSKKAKQKERPAENGKEDSGSKSKRNSESSLSTESSERAKQKDQPAENGKGRQKEQQIENGNDGVQTREENCEGDDSANVNKEIVAQPS